MDNLDRLLLHGAGFARVSRPETLSPQDWAALPDRAWWERLTPDAWSALHGDRQMPGVTWEALEERWAQSVGQSLLLQHQLLRIAQRMAAAGIDWCPLKGVALAVRLYGDVPKRQCGDIDLLVQPGDLPRAREALESLGYAQVLEHDGERDHHLVMMAPLGPLGVKLELHSGINLNRRPWFPQRWWDERATIDVGGVPLRIFRDEHLLTFLCLHAATHGFSAWGWLTDIARLCQITAPTGLQVEAGLRSPVYYSLRLIHHLGGARIDPGLIHALRPKPDLWPVVRWLALGGARLSPQRARLVAAISTASRSAGATRDWFLPGYHDFRKGYPSLSPIAARALYLPWLLRGFARAASALAGTALSLPQRRS